MLGKTGSMKTTIFTASLFCLSAWLLCGSACTAAAQLSTNRNGTLQAVAQSSTSVAVFWKASGASPSLFVNGIEAQGLKSSLDPDYGVVRADVNNLSPNTAYLFSLGKDEPGVVERTWASLPGSAEYDLLILGGTASGTSAAVSAARLGLRVALVETTNRLGGMASNGLGATDMRDMARANGFFEDFRRRVIAFYGSGDGRFYESRVANAIFKDMVYSQPNITVFLRSSAVKPMMNGNRVLGAVVKDNLSGQTGELRALVTIDAGYEGDFAAACGAPHRIGRESVSADEPHAGVIYFDNANQVKLPGSTGEGDSLQQSYAYLMIWKDYGDKTAHQISKPPFYDPEIYRHSPEWNKTWNYLYGRLPGGKHEINQHPFGIDWPGINHDYPGASAERRLEIAEMYKYRALGYLYFMQNERGHTNLGLADDEFMDSGYFPQQLYVREARRIMGEYLFRESDATRAREIHRADSIGIGDYPMDSHAMEDLKDPTRIDKGEGECWLRSFTPWYQVPAGVIVPKKIEGLLVTNAASGTHIGYGTLRMEPVRIAMGQAGAALTYLSILHNRPLREINAAWVQDKILSQHSYINWNSDVNRDTRHFKAINFLGARGVFVGDEFRPTQPLTRGEASDMLHKLVALEGGSAPSPEIDQAAADDPVRRGEFAKWLVQAKQMVSKDWDWVSPFTATYTDVPKESQFYQAVETLAAKRITAMLFDNAESGMFKPEGPISRADAAQAIYLAHRAYAMNNWLHGKGIGSSAKSD